MLNLFVNYILAYYVMSKLQNTTTALKISSMSIKDLEDFCGSDLKDILFDFQNHIKFEKDIRNLNASNVQELVLLLDKEEHSA